MRVALQALPSKLLFALGSTTLCLASAFVSLRHYQASTLAAGDGPATLRAALRVEPLNAEAWEQLARTQLFGEQDANAAIASLQRATALNPHASSAWLLLATALQVHGDDAGQQQAIQR